MADLPTDVASLLDAAAERYGIKPAIARAVAWTESRGKQSAVGTSGELGVMQLMAGTAQMLGVDPRSLTQNIDGGVRYLAQQIKRFGEIKGIAGYNGGPGMAMRDETQWPAGVRQYVANVRARAELEQAKLAQGVRAADGPFPLSEVTRVERPERSSLPPLPLSSQQRSGSKPGGDDEA